MDPAEILARLEVFIARARRETAQSRARAVALRESLKSSERAIEASQRRLRRARQLISGGHRDPE